VTASFLIFAVVTAFFLIFAVVTEFFFSCLVPTLFFGSWVAANAAPPRTRKTAIDYITFAYVSRLCICFTKAPWVGRAAGLPLLGVGHRSVI